jgi:predicted hotdog family 3-hydroxylacyl-ACP dehydratase
MPSLEELILHRGPMRLIDEVLEHDPWHIVVAAVVNPSAWYAEPEGAMPAWVGIELMAQAIGAYSGLEARARGEAPQVGYLLGTRRYHSTVARFPPGARLLVSAHCTFRDESGLGAFDCELAVGEEVLASASVKVFETGAGRH